MARLLPLVLIAALGLGGCDLFCDGCDFTLASLFEDEIVAGATPDEAVYERPFTIRAAVTPRFTGTGAFTLHRIAGRGTADVLTQSGAVDLTDTYVDRVEFEAGVRKVVEWTVRLGPQNGYRDGHGFPITVFADSAEVDGVLRPVEASEVSEAFRDGHDDISASAMHWPRLVLD